MQLVRVRGCGAVQKEPSDLTLYNLVWQASRGHILCEEKGVYVL